MTTFSTYDFGDKLDPVEPRPTAAATTGAITDAAYATDILGQLPPRYEPQINSAPAPMFGQSVIPGIHSNVPLVTKPPVVDAGGGTTSAAGTGGVVIDPSIAQNAQADANNANYFDVQMGNTTPADGSVASLTPGMLSGFGYSAEDQAYLDLIAERQREASLATFDPQQAYQEALGLQQARIDAINSLYNDQLNLSRTQNEPVYQARLQQNRLQQGLGGFASSAAGSAQTTAQQQANQSEQQQIEQAINIQRQAALTSVFDAVDSSVAASKLSFEEAKASGTEGYVKAIKGRKAEREKLLDEAVGMLINNGLDISAMTPEEISLLTDKLGVTEQQITSVYKTRLAEAQAAEEERQLERAKAEADIAKTEAQAYNEQIKEEQAALDRALDEKKISIDAYNAETSRLKEQRIANDTNAEAGIYDFTKDDQNITELYSAGETDASIQLLQQDIAKHGIDTVINDANVSKETRKVLEKIFNL